MHPCILIADDHSMIRTGLKIFIQMNLGYDDIHEVSTCRSLMNELLKKKYTHLVLDVILSDGNSLEVIPNIRRVYPELAIMIFSMQPPEIYGGAVRQYGVNYYLPKASGEEEMLQMLQRFFENETPLKENTLVQNFDTPFSSLTPRELEILHYLLQGIGTNKIGETLNLKKNTVSTMKSRIFEKTNAANLKELIELATLYNVNF